jgi:hypothetical protein
MDGVVIRVHLPNKRLFIADLHDFLGATAEGHKPSVAGEAIQFEVIIGESVENQPFFMV